MGQPPRLSSERHSIILELLERKGVVRHAELRELLKVSPGTIRADLRELEMQGLLEIVHGGAVTRRAVEDSRLIIDERMKQRVDEKRRIGARAAQLITTEQTLIVDSGTTTLELVNALANTVDYLQIITHGLNIATAASRLPNCEVMMPGGIVRTSTLTLVGPQVISFFNMIHAQCVFLATNGFSLENGVTTANLLEAEIKRVLVQRGEKVILLADSSKYGRSQALRVIPMSEVDVVVTDTELSDEVTKQMEDLGVEVLRV